MAIYAISDLHLALSIDKPMDVFGEKWSDYMERIKSLWEKTVTYEDSVIIPGDISWATYLEQAHKDFEFIDSLPGNKIILKGNHDYWWTTSSKLNRFLEENNFTTIKFLHNNSYKVGNNIICGTRGWNCPGDEGFSDEDEKIYKRELMRLELSLKDAAQTTDKSVITALHYPPFNSKLESSGFVEIMKQHGVKLCIYGHLHGDSTKNAVIGEMYGVEFRLVSADYLDFMPLRLEI